MRTSYIVSVLLILMLLGATTSLAGSSADAEADSSDIFDSDFESNNYSVTAPANGTYDWSYSLHVYAVAHIADVGFNSSYASASASASVDRFGRYTESISVSAHWSHTPGTDDDSDSASDSGTSTLRAGAPLEFTESCSAMASWNSFDINSAALGHSHVVTWGSVL